MYPSGNKRSTSSVPEELQREGESPPTAVSPGAQPESSGPAPSQIFGVRNEAGYWVKADPGNPNGLRLKEELQAANVTTVPAIVEHAAKKLGNKPCLGTRQLLARKRFVADGKEMEKLHLGEYSFLTYREVQDMVVSFSQGLAKIGTGIEEIVASLRETEVSVIITSHDLLGRTAEVIRKCPAITHVIVFEDQLEGVGTVPEGLMEVVVIPYKEVVETGKYLNAPLRQPTGSDVAIIMYTSGSMNRPKGTELTHDNIVSSIIALAFQVDLRSDDRFLAFLPLAHVMEFTTEIALVSLNIVIMYGSPMTLTSNGPKIMEGTLGDAQVAKPTCINAAPLILDRIVERVTQAVEENYFLNNQISEKALTLEQMILDV
ncbi:uncharacterized protein LOC134772691 [Penaeus indicus]|uniref:uncharacterized protein LOC134772691 n=1 Tax=Penaeus indicus TaxID=29960 RepID=UPI00300C5B4D